MVVAKTRTYEQGATQFLETTHFLEALANFANLLEKHEQVINDLNVYPVPDSDTGTNSLLTIRAGLAGQLTPEIGLGDAAGQVGALASAGAMGNSGVILAQYLVGLASGLPDKATQQDWAGALAVASQVARAAVLSPEEGTMLTVAQAALVALPSENFESYFQEIQREVRASLVSTQEMLPALKLAEVVDAGGVVITLLHDSFAQAIGVVTDPLEILPRSGLVEKYDGSKFEVMFSVSCNLETKASLEKILLTLGDSIALAGTQPNFTVHVHSNDPSAVIEACERLVELSDLRIIEFGS
jgi:dihydroxyacetone kinase-like predicted kinase